MKEKKLYYIAEREGDTPRVAKYFGTLCLDFRKEDGWIIRRGYLPKDYWYITQKRGRAR